MVSILVFVEPQVEMLVDLTVEFRGQSDDVNRGRCAISPSTDAGSPVAVQRNLPQTARLSSWLNVVATLHYARRRKGEVTLHKSKTVDIKNGK